MKIFTLFAYLICCSLIFSPAVHAADSGIALSKELLGQNKGSEYISGDYPGAVMMKINLWGSVQKPGIHYVPAKTDLMTLLSYGGGPMEKARLDDVFIKRISGGKETVIDVDVEDLLSSTAGKTITLEANDIVVIPTKTPLFSENTIQLVTVVGGLMAITLSYYVLKDQL
jgi:hypothetical protein